MKLGLLVIAACAGVVACYSPKLGEGDLQCGPGGQCPAGYQCAADGRCYQNPPGADDDAAPVIDAALADAAANPPAPSSAQEVTSGSGRVSGGSFTMDVQIGHPMSQEPSTGGGKSVEGSSAVKP